MSEMAEEEPDAASTTERLSRRDRAKRTAWEFGSLLVTGIVLTGVVVVLAELGLRRETALAGVAVVSVYFHVFSWGVDRLNIKLPQEFHEATTDAE